MGKRKKIDIKLFDGLILKDCEIQHWSCESKTHYDNEKIFSTETYALDYASVLIEIKKHGMKVLLRIEPEKTEINIDKINKLMEQSIKTNRFFLEQIK